MYKQTTKREVQVMNKIKACATDLFSIETDIGEFLGVEVNLQNLTEKEKEVIFSYTYMVGVNAFIQNPSEEMEKDIYDHLFNEEHLYLVFNKTLNWRDTETGINRVISFLSTRDIETSVGSMLYISGICVDPSFQGYGIGKKLIDKAYKDYHKAASLRTQNPVMKESFDKTVGGRSFPDGSEPPQDIVDLGLELAAVLGGGNYRAKEMLCKANYGGCLYGITPRSETRYYDDKFNQIDKNGGDALLCIKKL